MITVHGRTRQQFYKGQARWELVRPVVEAVDVPVVVNGDIIDLAAAREALRQSGAAAVMIGRGAQGQPWAGRPDRRAAAGRGASDAAPEGAELVGPGRRALRGDADRIRHAVGVRAARKHLDWYLEALGIALDKRRPQDAAEASKTRPRSSA